MGVDVGPGRQSTSRRSAHAAQSPQLTHSSIPPYTNLNNPPLPTPPLPTPLTPTPLCVEGSRSHSRPPARQPPGLSKRSHTHPQSSGVAPVTTQRPLLGLPTPLHYRPGSCPGQIDPQNPPPP